MLGKLIPPLLLGTVIAASAVRDPLIPIGLAVLTLAALVAWALLQK